MTQRGTDRGSWPDLPYLAWRETCATLHLWTQIVGKIRLSQTPWLNHSWQVPPYVTVRGLTTSPIPYGERAFQIDFDFIDHALRIETSDGPRWQMPLHAQPVARHARCQERARPRRRVARHDRRHPPCGPSRPDPNAGCCPRSPQGCGDR